ncbi:hypothetical protein AAIH54_34035, partial [Pseudomonas aeruginosa]
SPSSIKKSQNAKPPEKFKSAICIFAGNTFLHGITLASFTWSKYVTQSASVHSGIGDCTLCRRCSPEGQRSRATATATRSAAA